MGVPVKAIVVVHVSIVTSASLGATIHDRLTLGEGDTIVDTESCNDTKSDIEKGYIWWVMKKRKINVMDNKKRINMIGHDKKVLIAVFERDT